MGEKLPAGIATSSSFTEPTAALGAMTLMVLVWKPPGTENV